MSETLNFLTTSQSIFAEPQPVFLASIFPLFFLPPLSGLHSPGFRYHMVSHDKIYSDPATHTTPTHMHTHTDAYIASPSQDGQEEAAEIQLLNIMPSFMKEI